MVLRAIIAAFCLFIFAASSINAAASSVCGDGEKAARTPQDNPADGGVIYGHNGPQGHDLCSINIKCAGNPEKGTLLNADETLLTDPAGLAKYNVEIFTIQNIAFNSPSGFPVPIERPPAFSSI